MQTSKELPHMDLDTPTAPFCLKLMLLSRNGHENIQTTMDIYAHVTQKAKNEVADKFASYIGF